MLITARVSPDLTLVKSVLSVLTSTSVVVSVVVKPVFNAYKANSEVSTLNILTLRSSVSILTASLLEAKLNEAKSKAAYNFSLIFNLFCALDVSLISYTLL